MTHLYLIRHAQADGLRPDIVGSLTPDSGLSAFGITQAERLRDRLTTSGEIQADVLISSTLKRARETAEIIAPALDLPIVFDEEIQELNVGDCEGLNAEEIAERFGTPVSFDDEPFRRLGSTGESWSEFTFRSCRALDRITREYADKTIVLVTHGRLIGSSFISFLGLNTLKQLPIVLDNKNTSITHWQLAHFPGYGRDYAQWCLHSYHDYAHWKDLA